MEFLLQNLNTSIIVIAITFYIVFHYLSRHNKSQNQKSPPPEAGGAWPILGHLHIFSGSTLPHIVLGDMADKYGPVFTIRIGAHKVLVVSDRKLAKELSTVHDVHISSRPRFRAAKNMGYNYIMFGFSPYGPYWREIRKLISIELLSHRRLEQLKHIRVSEIDTSIKELYKVWNEKKNNCEHSGRVLVEIKKWFADLTLNVVLQMLAGKRYFGTAAVSDEEDGRRCQRVLRDFVKFVGVFVPADALPFLGWFDIGGYEKSMKEVAKEMDSLMDEWIQEHRLKKEAPAGEGCTVIGDEKDFIDGMLSRIEEIDLNGRDTDTVIKSTCLNLIAGGADTVMVMLTRALSLMMNNPHVLKKAQEELDMVVGKERKVNESDVNNFVYLQCIVKETLRLYPSTPLGGPRIFTEDCKVSKFDVPKGTWLLFNLSKLQRDPQVWSNPLEFNPERFINLHKDVDVLGQDFELIPFGAGRRICPGITLSLQILPLVLANLLHLFELSNVSNEAIDMTETTGTSNFKAAPLKILIAPRPSVYLY